MILVSKWKVGKRNLKVNFPMRTLGSMGQKESATPSALSTALAVALRVHMARRQLQQKDLVALAGRSEPYWSKRLAGKAGFTLGDVEQLAAGLGLSPERLMGDALAEMRPE